MSAPEFYSILGVSMAATHADLKTAYKKAALKWHPDRFAGQSEEKSAEAEAKFKEIAAAYEVLSDDQKRAMYDRYGEARLRGVSQPRTTGGKSGMPFAAASLSGGPGGASGAGMSPERAAEVLAQIFGTNNMLFGGQVCGMESSGRKRGRFMERAGWAASIASAFGGHGGLDGFAKRQAGASSPATLPRGTMVQLSVSDASREGTVGHIEGYDGATCRYSVVLALTGERISVRPTNVRQVIPGAK